MDLLRNILMQKKYYESIDAVETVFKSLGIAHDAVLQSLVFDKAVYPEEKDARLYVREHGYEIDVVEEVENKIVIHQLDSREFISSTIKEIELANGIVARVGVLKIMSEDNQVLEVCMSEEGKTLKLNSDLPYIIALATVVEGVHVNYGRVSITEEMLKSFSENHSNGAYGVDLMIDYDHKQSEAAGWVRSVFLSADGKTLYGEVKWTPKGAKALEDRDFRYFSPEFTTNYKHPHTGVSHGPTLLGGGLVNRPFLKMDAIVSFKEKQNNKEVKMETIALTEHNAIKADLEKTITEFKLAEEKAKSVIQGQKDEIKTLSEENAALKKEKEQAELEAKNEKLFSENRITAAQLKALNEGKDIYEVLSLGESVNSEPKGKGGKTDEIVLSEADEKARLSLGVSKEDYIKYNS